MSASSSNRRALNGPEFESKQGVSSAGVGHHENCIAEETPGNRAMRHLQNSCGNRAVTGVVQHSGELSVDSAYRDAASRPGTALPASLKSGMEEKFSEGFDDVRLHDGADARHFLGLLHARAATVGSSVFISDPSMRNDSMLLSHELAHVVQQSQADTVPTLSVNHNATLEQEADKAAETSLPVNIAHQSAHSIQCQLSEVTVGRVNVVEEQINDGEFAAVVNGRQVLFFSGPPNAGGIQVIVRVDESDSYNVETGFQDPTVVLNVSHTSAWSVQQDEDAIQALSNLGIQVVVNLQYVDPASPPPSEARSPTDQTQERRSVAPPTVDDTETDSTSTSVSSREEVARRQVADLTAKLASIDAEAQASGLSQEQLEGISERRNRTLEALVNAQRSLPPPPSRPARPPRSLSESLNTESLSGPELDEELEAIGDWMLRNPSSGHPIDEARQRVDREVRRHQDPLIEHRQIIQNIVEDLEPMSEDFQRRREADPNTAPWLSWLADLNADSHEDAVTDAITEGQRLEGGNIFLDAFLASAAYELPSDTVEVFAREIAGHDAEVAQGTAIGVLGGMAGEVTRHRSGNV